MKPFPSLSAGLTLTTLAVMAVIGLTWSPQPAWSQEPAGRLERSAARQDLLPDNASQEQASPAAFDASETFGPLDVEAVVRIALARNPSLKAQEERRQEVQGGIKEVRADAYPQLGFKTGWEKSRNPSLLNSADFADIVDMFPGGSFVPRNQELYTISADIRQPLFTWGKLGAALDLARAAVDVTEAQIDDATLATAAESAVAFYDLLGQRRSLDALLAQATAREEALAVVQARYDLQDATRLDLLRSEAALAQVSPSLEEARGRIAVAESRLRRALGGTGNEPLEACISAERELPPPPPLAPLQAMARKQRPEIDDLESQREALSHRNRVIRADGKPRLDLSGAYGRAARVPDDLADPLFRDWRLGLEVSWQFFDGGRRRGQVEQLESQRRQIAWQLEDLLLQIDEEVASAHAGVLAATARWRAAKRSAEAARETRRVAEESYREGVALQLDLLDAQQLEIAAEIEQITAYYDALSRWVELQRATGKLPSSPWSANSSRATVPSTENSAATTTEGSSS